MAATTTAARHATRRDGKDESGTKPGPRPGGHDDGSTPSKHRTAPGAALGKQSRRSLANIEPRPRRRPGQVAGHGEGHGEGHGPKPPGHGEGHGPKPPKARRRPRPQAAVVTAKATVKVMVRPSRRGDGGGGDGGGGAAAAVRRPAASDSLLVSPAGGGDGQPGGQPPSPPEHLPGGGGFPNGLPTVSTEPVVAAGSAVAVAAPALVPIALPAIVLPAIGLPSRGRFPAVRRRHRPALRRRLLRHARRLGHRPPPPPVRVGQLTLAPASTFRAGYGAYLRSAGIGQVASIALPGFVGILLLTGAGGLIGYRQAGPVGQ